MESGIFPISPSALLDRELRLQTNESLREWTEHRGLSFATFAHSIDAGRDTEGVADLAATLGISVQSILALAA